MVISSRHVQKTGTGFRPSIVITVKKLYCRIGNRTEHNINDKSALGKIDISKLKV